MMMDKITTNTEQQDGCVDAKETETYLQNYNKLKQIADQIDSQEVFDVDKALPQIEEATKAYSICVERINKVNEALKALV